MEKIIQIKLSLSLVLFSLIIVELLGFKWIHYQNQVTTLVIASGVKDVQDYAFAQAIFKIAEDLDQALISSESFQYDCFSWESGFNDSSP